MVDPALTRVSVALALTFVVLFVATGVMSLIAGALAFYACERCRG